MRVGYIGNYYRIPEYIVHSDFTLDYVIVEKGCMSDELFTFLMVRNILFEEVENSNDLNRIILESGIETWITCSYGKRIHIEEIKGIEIYNIHYSALPYFKGRHPTFSATIANELSVGISVHQVTEKIDAGRIISQRIIPYYIWENENDLFRNLTEEVPFLLYDLYEYLKKGILNSNIENDYGDYFPPVSESDYTIHINTDSPARIYNKVRTQAKYKGALIEWKGTIYRVYSVTFSRNPIDSVLCIPKDDYYVVFGVKEDE